jgi:hypothetical protein
MREGRRKEEEEGGECKKSPRSSQIIVRKTHKLRKKRGKKTHEA